MQDKRIVPFLKTGTPVLDFWSRLPPGFHSRCGSLACVLYHLYDLRFTWCDTCQPLKGQHCISAFLIHLLPPANEVCEGYVFTGACLSTRGVYTPPPGRYIPLPLGRYTPQQIHPPRQVHLPGQVHPPPTVHAGIRSTAGRYASHWNAFLFFQALVELNFMP